MDKISIELTREEAVAVRFMVAGAGSVPGLSPPGRLAAQEVLTKLDAAFAPAAPVVEPASPTE